MIEAEKDWLQKGKRAKGKIQANQVSTQSSALSNLEFGLYLWKVRFSIWKWDTFNIFIAIFFVSLVGTKTQYGKEQWNLTIKRHNLRVCIVQFVTKCFFQVQTKKNNI